MWYSTVLAALMFAFVFVGLASFVIGLYFLSVGHISRQETDNTMENEPTPVQTKKKEIPPLRWDANKAEYARQKETHSELKNIKTPTWLAFHEGKVLAYGKTFHDVDVTVQQLILHPDAQPYFVHHNGLPPWASPTPYEQAKQAYKASRTVNRWKVVNDSKTGRRPSLVRSRRNSRLG
jgi:hypothetical protein